MRPWFAIVLAGCHGGAASRWTGVAGAPSYGVDVSGMGRMHWDEYVKEIAPHAGGNVVALARPLAGASPSAMYGLNVISEGKNVGWVLDGDPTHGYRFVADVDHDGVLDNDPVHPMAKTDAGWAVDIEMRPGKLGGPPRRARIVFDGDDVGAQDMVIRRGSVALADRNLAFVVQCDNGDCTDPHQVVVGFDLDGDGAVDLDFHESYERYRLSDPDHTVVVADRTYTFDVAPDGGSVTLQRAVAEHAARPSLRVGTEAPAFDVVARGVHHALAELRGRVVVLDFFSSGCHFCVEDAPWLAGVHASGIDIITISDDGTRDNELLDAQHAPWWVAFEPGWGGPIAALYRVEAYPTYFVVDRDGKLACSRCKHEAVDATLARLVRHR